MKGTEVCKGRLTQDKRCVLGMRNGGCKSRSGVRKLVSCFRQSEDHTDNFSKQPGEHAGTGGNTSLAPELTQAQQGTGGTGGLLVPPPGKAARLLQGRSVPFGPAPRWDVPALGLLTVVPDS